MLFTSLFMYLSEALLFWFMVVGMWRLLWFVARRFGRVRLLGGRFGDRVTVEFLQRFGLWQVVFVAAWSVLLKLSLPVFIHSARGPLYHGGSQVYAGFSEWLGTLLALYGLWRVILDVPRGFRFVKGGVKKDATCSGSSS